MYSTAELKQQMDRVFRCELQAVAFRNTKTVFVNDMSPDIQGWLGLNRAIYRSAGIIVITPVAGVVHPELMRLVDSWTGSRHARLLTVTLGRQLGYLMPRNRHEAWYFAVNQASALNANKILEDVPTSQRPSVSVVGHVKDIVSNLVAYGVPWMRRLTDLGELIESMRTDRMMIDECRYYQLPAAYVLQGQTNKAREYVQQVLDELQSAKSHWKRGEFAKEYKQLLSKI